MSKSNKSERNAARRRAAWRAGEDPNEQHCAYPNCCRSPEWSPEEVAAAVTMFVLAACAAILVVAYAHGWRPR